MSDKSGIEWTEATWNPTTGCTKVSPGCKYCYAKHQAWPRLAAMQTGVYSGRKFEDVQVHVDRLDQPLRWTKPRRIFVNSMSDLFHEDVPESFIDQVFAVMFLSPQHNYQVLTKRPERMQHYLAGPFPGDGVAARVMDIAKTMAAERKIFPSIDDVHIEPVGPGGEFGDRWFALNWPMRHVWLGVSVEDQETADERIPLLLQTPAAVRWLSCEPLLGPVDLNEYLELDCTGDLINGPCELHEPIDWVVVGGESGPKARPMNALWCHSLMKQCHVAGVPFFMKQGSQANWPKFKDFSTFPPELQVREYPNDRTNL